MMRRVFRSIPGTIWLKRRLFGKTALTSRLVPVDRACNRGNPPPLRTVEPPESFPHEPRFILYRIIGNDLEPRHRKGQARENLPFILSNESKLSDCEKWFVVNRIVDPAEEEAIIDLLEENGQRYLHIPFQIEEYAAQPWDLAGIPRECLPGTIGFRRLREDQRARVIARLNRHRNNYVTHNNGARNLALAHGRKRAQWILPWDGNCFLTEQTWAEIRNNIRSQPDVPYWLVPMARVANNNQLLNPDYLPPATEEPQVIFRQDTREAFDERFFYGRRPKVELFWRLGVPGKWDEWAIEPWDLPCPPYSPDAGAWRQAGWVARLSSGRQELERSTSTSSTEQARALVRAQATLSLIDRLDIAVIERRCNPLWPVLCDHGHEFTASQHEQTKAAIKDWERTLSNDSSCKDKLQAAIVQLFLATLNANRASHDNHSGDLPDKALIMAVAKRAASTVQLLSDHLEPPTALRVWLTGKRSYPVLVPDLLLLFDSLRYLRLTGTLQESTSAMLLAWLSKRLKWLKRLESKRISARAGYVRQLALLIEKAIITHYLANLLAFRDAIRDAQLHHYHQSSLDDTISPEDSEVLACASMCLDSFSLEPVIKSCQQEETITRPKPWPTPNNLTTQLLLDNRLRFRIRQQ